MKRGEIWTVSGGPDYAGRPRPAVILQDEAFEGTASVTLCPFTIHIVDAPLLRLEIEQTPENGLRQPGQLMIDKITTVSKSKLDRRIGRLADPELLRLNRSLLVFLGLAGSSGK